MSVASARARVRASAPREQKTYRRRVQTNTRPTLWSKGEFVAIDGEGFSEGPTNVSIIGDKRTKYEWREHFYAYLAASDGSSLYSETRLTMEQCLSFVCAIQENNPNAIIVAFGGSYDVTQMVCHDLDATQIKRLLGKERNKLVWHTDEFDYILEYRPRKVLSIQRWRSGERRWTTNAKGQRVATPHLSVRLWDVWGFFQDTFTGVLKKWLPGDPDYEFIHKMKGERNIFERREMPEIRRYNDAELRCLVKVMNNVRDAINDLGLKITRWDGAGAIAAAMMTKQKVKQHKAELPENVFHAARCAYSGGHIETCKVGYYRGTVHHYDISSAYPDQFRRLPSLRFGKWQSGSCVETKVEVPPAGYTLVKVSFQFPDGLPFYPLFYRQQDGTIIYPPRGSGWYWYPEYEAALRYFKQSTAKHNYSTYFFKVVEWHHLREHTGERPFGWVEEYFQVRATLITVAAKNGQQSGSEKIIKLGLNSLYGKTAQQLGARLDRDGNLRLPPFFQLDWAGFVTSGCRAKLMEGAIQKPWSIIGFATDGLFATEPLDLYCPPDKELGAWEYKQHDGITMVMPGVYWLHDQEKTEHHSRGFNKKEMQDAIIVHDAWKHKLRNVPISLQRLITLGTCGASDEFWAMRGTFATSSRRLCLDGDNSKRYPINLSYAKPHLGLVNTIPRDHDLHNLAPLLELEDSAPYPIAWIDGVIERDLIEGEMADEIEARDAQLA